MSEIIARTGLLLFILGAITLFEWPDITPYLTYIQQFVNMMYILNFGIDMDTFFTIAKVGLTIEIILLARKLIITISSFIGSGQWQPYKDPNEPGQGTWFGEI